MNVALHPIRTVDEFIAWGDRQELRHEFDGVRPVAMTGGTEAHAIIRANLIQAVGRRLQRPCRILGSDPKLRMARTVRYPDAMIVCTRPQPRRTALPDPVISPKSWLAPTRCFNHRRSESRCPFPNYSST